MTRDEALRSLRESTALRARDVDVPGLGLVRVRPLRLSQVLPSLQGEASDRREVDFLAHAVVDDDGVPLMSADEWDQWAGANLVGWSLLAAAVAEVSGTRAADHQGN